MYQKSPQKKFKLRYVFIALGAVILVGASLFTLEKTGVTNFYTSNPVSTSSDIDQATGEVPSANPTNTVDYSPPKSDETSTVADKNPTPANRVSPINPELSIAMTSSRKSGDLYLIKAIISGTDSASCKATMIKGDLTATASSGAAMIEGQYSCKDLSIPMSQLTETGEWDLILTVTDKNGSQASTTEKVIL